MSKWKRFDEEQPKKDSRIVVSTGMIPFYANTCTRTDTPGRAIVVLKYAGAFKTSLEGGKTVYTAVDDFTTISMPAGSKWCYESDLVKEAEGDDDIKWNKFSDLTPEFGDKIFVNGDTSKEFVFLKGPMGGFGCFSVASPDPYVCVFQKTDKWVYVDEG